MIRKKILLISGISLIFYVGLRWISTLIPSNTVFLCGEFQYLLDYPAVLSQINRNINFADPSTLFGCPYCDLIINYSWFFSFWYFQYLNLSNYLAINPLLYFVLSGILIQLISVYVFIRFGLEIKPINKINIVLVSALLILPIYKTKLLCSGTSYAINHSLVFIIVSFLLYITNNLSKFKIYQLVLVGGIGTILLYISIALVINYVPLFIYILGIIVLLRFKILIYHLKSVFIILFSFLFTSIFLNYSWLLNLNKFSLEKSFSTPANNEMFLDAFTGRYLVNDYGIYILAPLFFIFLLITIFSNFLIKPANTIRLLILYLFIVALLMGNNLQPNVYAFVFYNFPLMNTIRSTHRLYALIFMIQIYWSYTLFEYLRQRSIIRYLLYRVLLCIISILLIYFSWQQFHTQYQKVSVPIQYKQTVDYIRVNHNDSKILYLPFYTNTLTNQYEWTYTTKEGINPYSFQNPFLSIYYLNNQLPIFEWYNYPPNSFHIDRLKNYYLSKHLKKEIPSESELISTGADLLIIDRYSDSLKKLIVPEFTNITKLAQFGKIELYKINVRDCIEYYGNVVANEKLCFNTLSPEYLNNKTQIEYLYETKFDNIGNRIPVKKTPYIITGHISSATSREHLTANNILFNYNTIEINPSLELDSTNISSLKINNDSQYLIFESINIPNNNGLETSIEISSKNHNEKIIIEDTTKMKLYLVNLEVFNNEVINIYTRSPYVLMSHPTIYNQTQYDDLVNQANTIALPDIASLN